MKSLFLIITIFTCYSASSFAAKTTASGYPKTTPDNFRCEKMDANLSSLKDKLLVTCDLDRPYSIAATDNISSRTYVYCCHMIKSDE